jgi:hypothetical protein
LLLPLRAQNVTHKNARFDFLVVFAAVAAASSSSSHYAIIKEHKETAFATALSIFEVLFVSRVHSQSNTIQLYMMYMRERERGKLLSF